MLLRHRGHEPAVHPSAYVAPNATVVGDVRIGPRARVMYGAVLDAEASRIEVGECAVICEHAVLRATAAGGTARPVVVGDHASEEFAAHADDVVVPRGEGPAPP